ncbi:PE-PPE domain-containing protein [Mycolicibacterium agri]|uniref:PE-PPE domain-containing protein n=1 Tax=Mycolicibacterium agri TaxID=36811 RepID=A0A2A7MWY0_MYCAG|nr:PE-PPE domain-containing protein [Mycolicibacterium agri]PEG36332.1 PE-PPE domain-containing protein [Mycolicibacterium agri]GFG49639.1 hypothetical protein MAGR_10800 [Mycolicibacterium agri]
MSGKHIGRIGALAVALGVGFAAAPVSTASAEREPCSDTEVTCALILGGTTVPTPDASWLESVKNQFIAPTHPGYIEYTAVTAPQEFWPITGFFRVLGLALGPSEIFGLDGPAWPDEPLWKLSGLFDLTADVSLEVGANDLEDAIASHPNKHLIIYGQSQGTGAANVVKRRLAQEYPEGTTAPDIDFVLGGDPNLPNGGLAARFPNLYIPIVNLTLNGSAPTNTQFDTVEINRKYDGFADFPLYPLNFIADVNAVLGVVYVHMYGFDVSLPADDPTKSPAYQGEYGDTSYYLFDSPDLPLFGPLRTAGVPEPLIDVVEPFFREVVELGYDRSIEPWKPTPARLIPRVDPAAAAGNFADAISEGFDNARALIQPQAPVKPAAVSTDTDVIEGADLQTNQSVGESVDDNGGVTALSEGRTHDPTPSSANRTRPTPLRDAVTNVRSGIKKAVADVTHSIKKALSVNKTHGTDNAREDGSRSPATEPD